MTSESARQKEARRVPSVVVVDKVARTMERRGQLLPGAADRLVKASASFVGASDPATALRGVEAYLKDHPLGRRLVDPRYQPDEEDTPLIAGLRAFGLTKEVANRLYGPHAIDTGHTAQRSPLTAAYRVLVAEGMAETLGSQTSSVDVLARVGLAGKAEESAKTPVGFSSAF